MNDIDSFAKTKNVLQAIMEVLDSSLPDAGIVLLVFPLTGPDKGRVNYIANIDRDGAKRALKEIVGRWDANDKKVGENT